MNKSTVSIKIIQKLCNKHNLSLSTAESCSGGYLSKLMTDTSGSSKFYNGSIIAYSNKVKTDILKVPNDVLVKNGAVSREVSILMAEGVLNLIDCDIAVSTTGIMEQSKQDDNKAPQVYITVKSHKHQSVTHHYLKGNRDENRLKTINYAFECLYDFINKHYLVS